jgi:hypothetical protein
MNIIKKHILPGFIFVTFVSACANTGGVRDASYSVPHKYEYRIEDYENIDSFTALTHDLGEEGWLLTACPTTGRTIARATGQPTDSYIARSPYCIFAREVDPNRESKTQDPEPKTEDEAKKAAQAPSKVQKNKAAVSPVKSK